MRSAVTRAVLLLIALAAVRLLPRAVRREARALELITLLFQVCAAAATANTAKVRSTEARTAALESRTGAVEAKVAPINNATFLGGLSAVGGVGYAGSSVAPSSGAAPGSYSQAYTNALANNVNGILAYVQALAIDYNTLLGSMANNGFT